MNTRGFTSAFAPQLDACLTFKEKMGFYGSSRIWYLQQFDAYCTAHERTVFDRDTVEGWVNQQLTRSGRYRSQSPAATILGRLDAERLTVKGGVAGACSGGLRGAAGP